jgi:hypothetical protein
MTKSKKLLTIALTTLAIAAGSLATTGDALAGGSGGKGGHHDHFFFSRGFTNTIVVVDPCYRWINGVRVFICH